MSEYSDMVCAPCISAAEIKATSGRPAPHHPDVPQSPGLSGSTGRRIRWLDLHFTLDLVQLHLIQSWHGTQEERPRGSQPGTSGSC
jgi:hypothetical protein